MCNYQAGLIEITPNLRQQSLGMSTNVSSKLYNETALIFNKVVLSEGSTYLTWQGRLQFNIEQLFAISIPIKGRHTSVAMFSLTP